MLSASRWWGGRGGKEVELMKLASSPENLGSSFFSNCPANTAVSVIEGDDARPQEGGLERDGDHHLKPLSSFSLLYFLLIEAISLSFSSPFSVPLAFTPDGCPPKYTCFKCFEQFFV